MNHKGRIKSKGTLDRVVLEEGRITVEGWVASEGAGPITGFQALVSGENCPIVEQFLHLPSADVREVFPALDSVDQCRFMVRLNMPSGVAPQTRDFILAIIPLFAETQGKNLWHIVAPSFPDPPKALVDVIGGNLREVSLEFLDYFVDLGKLKSTDSVLDVGCGMGRMTYGLVNFLAPSSRYEGFDILPDLIEWAQREITPRYPIFHFQLAPIFNSFYNPGGHLKPTEFVFPYEDASFEFIFLTSVFTHMPGDEIRHYMHEIRRVLKPGGRALITCFLLNAESVPLISAGKSSLDISHPHGDSKIASRANPDYAVGFDETLFKSWLETRGLSVVDTLYGSWCGRANSVSYQDMLIVQG